MLQEAGVESHPADLVGDDHVCLLGEIDRRGQAAHEHDAILEAIRAADLARDLDHAAFFDRIDTPRAWLPGSHRDRKSTRLNSSHRCISYAVFCLKKKKNQNNIDDASAARV